MKKQSSLNKTKTVTRKKFLFLNLLLAATCLNGLQSVQAQTGKPEPTSKAITTSQPAAADTGNCCKNELSIWGAGGLSTLYYNPNTGTRTPGLGGAAGIGYTYYISKNFGILAGAEIAFYNTQMKLKDLRESQHTQDQDGQEIDYNSVITHYKEKQKLTSINIPLNLQYQTSGTHKFYAAVGLKLGIPISSSYEVTQSEITTSGYYYDWHHELYDQGDLGYGTYTSTTGKNDIDINLLWLGTLEAGAKWHLNKTLSLYTGAYVEYGFNDAVDRHDSKLVAYNHQNPENQKLNSTLTSEYTDRGQTKSITDHVSPLSAGVKIRLGVNLCSQAKEKPATVQEPAKAKEPVKRQEQAPAKAPATAQEPKVTPATTPAPATEAQTPQSKKAKARAIIAARGKDEDEDGAGTYIAPEMEEDLRRAVVEYGSTVKGTISIELEGYELDQSTLSPKMEQILDEKIAQIKSTYGNDVRIVAEGHTCNTGKAEYNLKLGLKRAGVVRDYLTKKGGYAADRVQAISKGQTSPIAPNDTEANKKKNRRVVLIIKDL